MTQNIIKIKIKKNAQIVTEAHTRRRKKKTILNIGDERLGLNSCGNNYILNHINKNNRQ